MQLACQRIKCMMSFKIHFLHSYLDIIIIIFFFTDVGVINKTYDERFLQNICKMVPRSVQPEHDGWLLLVPTLEDKLNA